MEVDEEKVHKLALGIVKLEEIGWEGNEGVENLSCRLLVELEKLLPPRIRLPERRLGHLVEVAISEQTGDCIYHNLGDAISLYEDHCCGRDEIPIETVQVSEEGVLSLKHTLHSHQNPVSFVSWSPDDTMLFTCGNGEVLKLWDVEMGTCKHTFGEKNPIVSSCAWFPDSKRLVCGSSDPDKCIYMWDLDGNELEAWRGVRVPKVSDLAVTPDGEYLFSICSEKDIRIYNFGTKTEWVVKEEHAITSLSVSRDSEFLIINLNSQEIHM
ncbi:hypothetical protein GIB67_024597 [Kingdonia uniflora]|uniref:Uncharacterized protein n=1 Tax=Kingdonia uniflora TaxID=39325 RepID=A0A7J7LPA9_9MAGN|nr:hypothetical protein GIB67_024597 [Kingdonia uniflora]